MERRPRRAKACTEDRSAETRRATTIEGASMRSHWVVRLTSPLLAAALFAVGVPVAGAGTAGVAAAPSAPADRQTPVWGSCGVPGPCRPTA